MKTFPPVLLLILGLTLCAAVAPTSAQQCGSTVGSEGFGTLNQQIIEIDVIGVLAYVLDTQGLTVYDVSDPWSIQQIGQLTLDHQPVSLAVAGGVAHLGSDGRISIVDVSDPASPRAAAELSLSNVVDVAASDGLGCYVGPSWMSLVDVADPQAPEILVLFEPGSPYWADVALEGDRAYIARETDGFLVVDISDPTAPTEVLSWTDGFARRTAVGEGIVYAGYLSTMTIVKTGGDEAIVAGSLDLPGHVRDLTIMGALAVVVCDSAGVQIVDVSDPFSPTIVGGLDDLMVETVGGSGTVAFAGGDDGLLGADLTDPRAPLITDTVDTSGHAYDVEVREPYAFVADGRAGLQVVEISQPAGTTVVGGLPIGDARDIELADGYGYVLDGTAAVLVVDVSDPTGPFELSRTTVSSVDGIVASEGYVYGLDRINYWTSELQIVDATNPRAPHVVGSLELEHGVEDLAVANAKVYCVDADADPGLLVIDAANPVSPTVVAVLDLFAMTVEANGDLVYLGSSAGLEILNMSDPMAPVLLGSAPADIWAQLKVVGTNAFGIGGYGALDLVDVSDPTSPGVIDVVTLEPPVLGLDLSPGTSTIWAAKGSSLQGVAVGCPECEGVEVAAVPDEILTGAETAQILVTIKDRFGNRSPGQALSGTSSRGTLDPFIDNGDGSYTSVLTSAADSGWVELEIELNGQLCEPVSPLRIRCAAGTPPVPAGLQLDPALREIFVTWQQSGGAVGYRVQRGPHVALTVDGGAVTQAIDSSVSPGREYCYTVAAVDTCGGTTDPSAEVCTETNGAPLICPALAQQAFTSHGFSSDLDFSDGNVFVAGLFGLRIFSLESSSLPRLIGFWQPPGVAKSVDVVGELAYVAVARDSLSILDVSDPTSPVLVNSLGTEAIWSDAVVVEGFAYLANLYHGVDVVDVRDPMSLELVASEERMGRWERLAVRDGSVYVVDEDQGTMIIDVSAPTAPSFVTVLETPPEPLDIAVEAGRAYVVDEDEGLLILDVSDPLEPAVLGSSDVMSHASRVAVDGSYAYVGDRLRDLTVLDVSDPTAPVMVGIVECAKPPTEMVVSDGLVGITSVYRGLEVVDVAEPSAPVVVASAPPHGWVKGIALRGSIAYAACSEGGLRVLDLADPQGPAILATAGADRGAYDLDLVGQHALTCTDRGLRVVDVSVPESPVGVGFVETAENPTAVAGSGGFAYVANGTSGLKVVDVSDPTAPVVVGSLDTPGDAQDVAIHGSTAYIADGSGGLRVVDIEDPTMPAPVWRSSDPAYACHVHSEHLYAGGNGHEVSVFLIADPHAPEMVGSIEVSDSVHAIAAHNEYLYAGVVDALAVIDVTDPTLPEVVVEVQSGGPIEDIVFDGGSLHLAAASVLLQYTLACEAPGDLDADGWIEPDDVLLLLDVIYRGLLPPGDPDPDGSGATDCGDLSVVLNAM